MLEMREAKLDEIVSLFPSAADSSVHTQIEHWRAWVEYHLKNGPCVCAYYQNHLVGAGGIDLRHPGIGTPWVVFDGRLSELPKGKLPTVESLAYLEQAMTSIRTMLDVLCRKFKIHHLHTDSYKDFRGSQRLLEYLGFHRLRKEKADRYFYSKDLICHRQ